MASAVRLTDVGVVGVGDFGVAVQQQLTGRGAQALRPGDITSAAPDGIRAVVLALWRPMTELCDQVDAAAHASGFSWLPVVAEHPHITVGPRVAPTSGPCYRCYQARWTQHATQPESHALLTAAYDADDAVGVRGHLPHHVRTAAGLAVLALHTATPGRVQHASMDSGQIVGHRVVPVHGCSRCGADDESPGADGVLLKLAAALSTHSQGTHR
ncbi:TOMM precursor leader peptide-binding protein [Streptomyces sp. NPDC020965]|uniref:TOMM precursor leader peptide-binding protein n=1 Tax=Streptomyces sp. NPDC020965 TaxID=3365105 RepID=UPI00378915D5